MIEVETMLNACFPGEAYTDTDSPCARCGVFISPVSVVDSFDGKLKNAKKIHASWHSMIEA